MTPAISTAIVATQVALILLALIIGLVAKSRRAAVVFAWISTALALVAVAIAAASTAPAGTLNFSGETSSYVVYAVIAFIAAAISWGVVAVVSVRLRAVQERYYAKPETRAALGDELREVLRTEGIALDERLVRAEQEREQFLYALEDQHARQIAGLAQEYQHEASTILRNLLDQLAAERLEPMVEERLAEQRTALERELGAIDSAAAGEALTKVREEHTQLLAQIDAATARIDALREQNPERSIEDQTADRLARIDSIIDAKVAEATAGVDAKVAERAVTLEARLADVDAMLDEKVAAAGNPLVARMTETQGAVEQQLNTWMTVLDSRFAETEQILNQRIVEQEQALERRVGEVELQIEERLAQHVAAVEQVLATHDTQLQTSLAEQSESIGGHFTNERDRLIAELTEHGTQIQDSIATQLVAAEQQARDTVAATQGSWNVFTDELEQRFAETREEAMRAAGEIAAAEHAALEQQLHALLQTTKAEIQSNVDELGREAAWQRAQVERSTRDTIDTLQVQAQEALSKADDVFADLERVGNERVERIRREAEDALVQSRDYVGQLQDSLGVHLEQLRVRSTQLADEMNERLTTLTAAGQDSATQLEQYARDLIDAASQELGNVASQATGDLQARINNEFTATIQASLDAQQRGYESHLAEVAQRITQQVQGDLAGVAEHARAAVTGELDQLISQSRQHAQTAQEQSFRAVMNDIARQQTELAEQARGATDEARRIIEDGLRENRRQLEGAMASMGAHMREELVRFNDEGQRRVDAVVNQLRTKEQDTLREEDRKLAQARQELVRQHQGALEEQVRTLVGGLSSSINMNGAPAGNGGSNFTAGIERPSTPLNPGTGF